ncbi:MAG: hypothetical protein QM768_20335 [Agriterribacter sp.]
MSLKRTGSLRLNDNDYLKTSTEHKIIYSDQVNDFIPNSIYPFFFQDAERVYFASPESTVLYRQWIGDPDSIPPEDLRDIIYPPVSAAPTPMAFKPKLNLITPLQFFNNGI